MLAFKNKIGSFIPYFSAIRAVFKINFSFSSGRLHLHLIGFRIRDKYPDRD